MMQNMIHHVTQNLHSMSVGADILNFFFMTFLYFSIWWLTRKLQLGPSGHNWDSESSEHARVSVPKYSWGWGVGGTLNSPFPPPAGLFGGRAP